MLLGKRNLFFVLRLLPHILLLNALQVCALGWRYFLAALCGAKLPLHVLHNAITLIHRHLHGGESATRGGSCLLDGLVNLSQPLLRLRKRLLRGGVVWIGLHRISRFDPGIDTLRLGNQHRGDVGIRNGTLALARFGNDLVGRRNLGAGFRDNHIVPLTGEYGFAGLHAKAFALLISNGLHGGRDAEAGVGVYLAGVGYLVAPLLATLHLFDKSGKEWADCIAKLGNYIIGELFDTVPCGLSFNPRLLKMHLGLGVVLFIEHNGAGV